MSRLCLLHLPEMSDVTCYVEVGKDWEGLRLFLGGVEGVGGDVS